MFAIQVFLAGNKPNKVRPNFCLVFCLLFSLSSIAQVGAIKGKIVNKISRTAMLDFALEEEAVNLEEVVISAANSFFRSDESPLSLRTIGTAEIKRIPGGNRDIREQRSIRSG
jgi:hypothetical protein